MAYIQILNSDQFMGVILISSGVVDKVASRVIHALISKLFNYQFQNDNQSVVSGVERQSDGRFRHDAVG